MPPTYLKDYHCYNVNTNSKISSHNSIKYSISQFLHYDKFSKEHKAYLAPITSYDEPNSYSQVAKYKIWQEVMAREIRALEDNEIWEITILPEGRKVIG